MTALGKAGVKEMAFQNLQKANYAKKAFKDKGFNVVFSQKAIFNEFVVKLSKTIEEVNKQLLKQGMIGGYNLGRDYDELCCHMLIAVTELKSKQEIDRLIEALEEVK